MNQLLKNTTIASFVLLFFVSCGGDGITTTNGGDNIYPYDINKNATVYETAEDGSIQRWQVWQGHPIENVASGANGSKRSIYLKRDWDLEDPEHPINNANYVLPMGNDHQFILEFDKMKINGESNHCFTTGATVATDNGTRHISFNTFYDREGFDAEPINLDDGSIEMMFPLSMSYVNDTDVWKHIRLDLNRYLKKFEPDNNIRNVVQFYFQGGDDYLDNIRLVSE